MTASRISRRVFLSRNAKLAAAAGLPLWFWEEIHAAASATPPKGANERPRVALIGCGGRGTGVAKEVAEHAELLYASSNHMQNFFDCVRSRKAPVCDVEIGRKPTWDPNREVFLDDKEANAYVGRDMRSPWSLEKNLVIL